MGDDHFRKAIAAWLATLVLVFGVGVMVGWYLHAPLLVQIDPGWPPVQFNAALAFAALGLGLLIRAFGMPLVAAALSLPPIVIGGITLAAWVLDFAPGIDELFMKHYITVLTPVPGRMPVNNAFSLVLAGSALLLATLPVRPAFVTTAWILGLITFVRGAVRCLVVVS